MKDTPDGTIPVTAHMRAVDSMAKLHKSVVANLHADLDKCEKEKAGLEARIKKTEKEEQDG